MSRVPAPTRDTMTAAGRCPLGRKPRLPAPGASVPEGRCARSGAAEPDALVLSDLRPGSSECTRTGTPSQSRPPPRPCSLMRALHCAPADTLLAEADVTAAATTGWRFGDLGRPPGPAPCVRAGHGSSPIREGWGRAATEGLWSPERRRRLRERVGIQKMSH